MVSAKYFSLMHEGRLVFTSHFSQQENSCAIKIKKLLSFRPTENRLRTSPGSLSQIKYFEIFLFFLLYIDSNKNTWSTLLALA